MQTTMRMDSHESEGTVVTERRYGCYGFGLLISFLLLAFVIIISVVLLVESDDAGVLLGVLLGVLIVVGVAAAIFLQWRRRRANENRDRGATEWVHSAYSANQLNTTPVGDVPTASWHKWAPWKSTMSTTSASTASSPVYSPVMPSAPQSHHV